MTNTSNRPPLWEVMHKAHLTEDYYQVNATLADRNALGWARQSLVYHGGEDDVALGDVLPLLSGEI